MLPTRSTCPATVTAHPSTATKISPSPHHLVSTGEGPEGIYPINASSFCTSSSWQRRPSGASSSCTSPWSRGCSAYYGVGGAEVGQRALGWYDGVVAHRIPDRKAEVGVAVVRVIGGIEGRQGILDRSFGRSPSNRSGRQRSECPQDWAETYPRSFPRRRSPPSPSTPGRLQHSCQGHCRYWPCSRQEAPTRRLGSVIMRWFWPFGTSALRVKPVPLLMSKFQRLRLCPRELRLAVAVHLKLDERPRRVVGPTEDRANLDVLVGRAGTRRDGEESQCRCGQRRRE